MNQPAFKSPWTAGVHFLDKLQGSHESRSPRETQTVSLGLYVDDAGNTVWVCCGEELFFNAASPELPSRNLCSRSVLFQLQTQGFGPTRTCPCGLALRCWGSSSSLFGHRSNPDGEVWLIAAQGDIAQVRWMMRSVVLPGRELMLH